MSILIPDIVSSKKGKIYFKTFNDPMPHAILKKEKLKRNGLFERNLNMDESSVKKGKWTDDEHVVFMKACLQYGPKWKKIQQQMHTRTTAQIRSHAQKYCIKLCKKYNIEIKSKRKLRFNADHLNFPYKRKGKITEILNLKKMTSDDRQFLEEFKFYEKNINFKQLDSKRKQNIKYSLSIRKNNLNKITKNEQIIFSDEDEVNIKNNLKTMTNNTSCDHIKNKGNSNSVNDKVNLELFKNLAELINFNNKIISVLGEPFIYNSLQINDLFTYLEYKLKTE